MTKAVRNSNHELLRIVSMYMIVFIHANMYLSNFYQGPLWKFFNGTVNGICNIGVTCFILLSGFYGIRFDFKKFIKMELMMITFSLLEFILLFVFERESLQGAALLEQLVKTFLPFITRKYWFYSCYVCLFFLSGYLNSFVEKLPKKELERLLLFLLAVFSVIPTVCYFEITMDNGKGLIQMVMIYILGRYLALYRADDRLPKLKGILLFLVLWVINGFTAAFPLNTAGIFHHWCKDNSITNIVMAVILFYLFKGLRFQSGFVNRAATGVFAVFALNNTLVNVVMHELGTKVLRAEVGALGFLALAGVVFVILAVCLLIGVVREKLFGRADMAIARFVSGKLKLE